MYIDGYEVLTKLSESLINVIQTLENLSALSNLDIPSITVEKLLCRLNESENTVIGSNQKRKRAYLIQARPSSIKRIILAYPRKSFKQLLTESVVRKITVDDFVIFRLGDHTLNNQSLLTEADDTDNSDVGESDTNDAGIDTSPESMLETDDTNAEDDDQTDKKITVEANTVYELRIIYQTLKLLQQTFNFIYRVGADETIIELNVLFQRIYQTFLDFLDKFEMYEEDERKKIIARLKKTTLQLARALLNYVEHEL